VWQVLEGFVEKGTLQSIGVSDVDTELFIELHKWAKVCYSLSFFFLLLSGGLWRFVMI